MASVTVSMHQGLQLCSLMRNIVHTLARNHKRSSLISFRKNLSWKHCKVCTVNNLLISRRYCSDATSKTPLPPDESENKSVRTLLHDAKTPSENEPVLPLSDFPSDVHRYKSEAERKHSQRKHRIHLRVDPEETSILLFPGQGSQFVGMGQDLLEYPNVEQMYSVASEILGYDLLKLCLNGPVAELNKTEHCQPAVLVTSLAAVEKLKHTVPWAIEHCITTAGFSIGEYAALVFAGSLTFEDAVKVVKTRAQLMQQASEAVPSGMMTVFLGPRSKLKYACRTAVQYCHDEINIEKPVCQIANYLYPECKVIAGNAEALDFIDKNTKEFGLFKTKRVAVSGAFHTGLMAPAVSPLRKELKKVDIVSPLIPVHANIDSYKHSIPSVIEKNLVEQVYKPVMWEQTMHVLYSRSPGESFPHTYEVGPGKQLGAILGKVNRKSLRNYTAVSV